MSSESVYIVAAARTPIGNFNGTLSDIKASDLGSIVIKEVLKRAGVAAADVNEVIMGQTLTAGQGQNPARQASIKAGLPIHVPAYNINLLCGSGLKSVVLGLQSIRLGEADIVVCGGQENMSLAPHVMHLRAGIKMGAVNMLDSMLHDGLTDAFHNIHMGVTAEKVAQKFGISRAEQDESAVRSQNLAELAQQHGYFDAEIVPVELVNSKGKTVHLARDEYIKVGTTFEKLQTFKACFVENGTVTAGNASGRNDAAAALLLMSAAEVKKRNIKPMARIMAWAQTGIEPDLMGLGVISAVQAVLKKTGWSVDDVDLFELNEAYAAVSIAVNKQMELEINKVNVNGGAIALGHPIGASGSRVLVTLLYELQRRAAKKGVASLCIGGGMGIAMAIELV